METDTEKFLVNPVPPPAYRLPYDAAALAQAHADAEEEPKPVLPWWFGDKHGIERRRQSVADSLVGQLDRGGTVNVVGEQDDGGSFGATSGGGVPDAEVGATDRG